MIEHPVPQNVSAYQFHLVGDMTLKQFLELASGIVLAWLTWGLGFPTILKLPLTISCALLGFGLAFLPLEDRPLDQWAIAFLKAIYNATILTWKKSPREDLLEFKARNPEEKSSLASVMKGPAASLESLLQAYQLQAMNTDARDPLEASWQSRQQSFPELFRSVEVSKKVAFATTFPRKLAAAPSRPETRVLLHPLSPPENPGAVLRGEITIRPRQVKIPPQAPFSASSVPAASSQPAQKEPAVRSAPATLPSWEEAKSGTITASSPVVSTAIPLPIASAEPNVISGIVLGAAGQVIENAIIEIRDQNNLPIRALKTNSLGQFTIATPLSNGEFTLAVEKEGMRFGILKFETNGSVIPPIEIREKQAASS